MIEPMELDEAVLYRIAHGLADQLAEADNPNIAGCWRSNPAAAGELEAIVAEVVRRYAVADRRVDLVREAVEDALEGRRPRW